MRPPLDARSMELYLGHHATPGDYVRVQSGARLLFMVPDGVEERIEVKVGLVVVFFEGFISF